MDGGTKVAECGQPGVTEIPLDILSGTLRARVIGFADGSCALPGPRNAREFRVFVRERLEHSAQGPAPRTDRHEVVRC